MNSRLPDVGCLKLFVSLYVYAYELWQNLLLSS